jgi:hypothetical protein
MCGGSRTLSIFRRTRTMRRPNLSSATLARARALIRARRAASSSPASDTPSGQMPVDGPCAFLAAAEEAADDGGATERVAHQVGLLGHVAVGASGGLGARAPAAPAARAAAASRRLRRKGDRRRGGRGRGGSCRSRCGRAVPWWRRRRRPRGRAATSRVPGQAGSDAPLALVAANLEAAEPIGNGEPPQHRAVPFGRGGRVGAEAPVDAWKSAAALASSRSASATAGGVGTACGSVTPRLSGLGFVRVLEGCRVRPGWRSAC